MDLLLITQMVRGNFLNIGPEEVVQADLKDILKLGEHESRAREVLLQKVDT